MSKLIKKQISQLKGAQLDWAVAKACGIDGAEILKDQGTYCCFISWPHFPGQKDYCPSSDWSTGGPLIERAEITLNTACGTRADGTTGFIWEAEMSFASNHGDTPLVAAMRAFVHANLGNEIEVPACES